MGTGVLVGVAGYTVGVGKARVCVGGTAVADGRAGVEVTGAGVAVAGRGVADAAATAVGDPVSKDNCATFVAASHEMRPPSKLLCRPPGTATSSLVGNPEH